jgi:hypothetical protein
MAAFFWLNLFQDSPVRGEPRFVECCCRKGMVPLSLLAGQLDRQTLLSALCVVVIGDVCRRN